MGILVVSKQSANTFKVLLERASSKPSNTILPILLYIEDLIDAKGHVIVHLTAVVPATVVDAKTCVPFPRTSLTRGT